MIWLIKFLQKRPSDLTIRIIKIIIGLTLILWWYYNLIYQGDSLETTYFWMDVNEWFNIAIKYIIIIMWFLPLTMWIANMCIFKKKHMKIIQIVMWFLLMYLSSKIVESPNLDFDSLLWIIWFLAILAWITWKCITTKCLKYKEKITKIRV